MTAEETLAAALRENADLQKQIAEITAAANATQQKLEQAEARAQQAEAQVQQAQVRAQQAEVRAQQAEVRAQQAEKELMDFVYAASHDLQEPLRAIVSYSQLLARQANGGDAAELTGFVIAGAKRATDLVQALLGYSRAGASPRLSTVNGESLAQVVLYKTRDRIRHSSAEIKCGELPQISADEAQIVQVFEHLITNAIAYHPGGPIELEISASEGDDGYVFAVHDNGRGVEPRFHEQIFLPFKRLHGKEVPGTGLGLAICRKIVGAHGGRIWVESDGQHGATFLFTIPY